MENNELYHHGIKGMRWGIRRYQNKDGSLTPAGKKRYDSMSDDAREASRLRQKKPSQMSNAELRKLNERTQLEQNYSRLHPNAVQKGVKIAATVAAGLGTTMNLYNNSDKVVQLGKNIGNKIVDGVGDMVIKDLMKHS